MKKIKHCPHCGERLDGVKDWMVEWYDEKPISQEAIDAMRELLKTPVVEDSFDGLPDWILKNY